MDSDQQASAGTGGKGRVGVEMFLDGVWEDITDWVYVRDGITITRGRADESSQIEPSSMRFTVNNRDGRFSPRNPLGPYYGRLGRNTLVRCHTITPTMRLLLPGADTDYATCPHQPGLTITGDLDVRVDAKRPSWRRFGYLAGRLQGGQRSWALNVNSAGRLTLVWSTDGNVLAVTTVSSTVILPIRSGRQAMRATLDVDNAAGGHTITFWTAPTMAGPWTRLGEPVTRPGTTSVFAGTSPLMVGNADTTAIATGPGQIFSLQVRAGIDGPLVAAPDFTTATPTSTGNATHVIDQLGNTFTTTGQASITARRYRFTGEVSSFPARWDTSGRDVWVPIEAAGILRRLGQGASPTTSVMRRGITALLRRPVAYWPCEDGSFAQVFAPGIPGGRPMRWSGTPTLATFEGFIASDPLPLVGDSVWTGTVAPYPPTGAVQVRWLMAIPEAGLVTNRVICRVSTGGTASTWDVVYSNVNGGLRVRAYDSDGGAPIFESSDYAFGVNGRLWRASLELKTDGRDTDWGLYLSDVNVGEPGGAAGTVTGRTVTACTQVAFGPQRAGLPDVHIGHISVQSRVTSNRDLADELQAYTGERALTRLLRLCADAEIPLLRTGSTPDTAAMGPQRRSTFSDLLTECAEADFGLLGESREAFGLLYHSRESLYSRRPAVVLSHAGGHITQVDPVDDDQRTRNDITVTRTNGSSQRAVQLSGPLSVQPSPAGVGIYDESVEVNLLDDETLQDQASWRLHLGTVDEPRYPQIALNLAAPAYLTDPQLAQDVLDVDVGDRIDVTDMPAWVAQGVVEQVVQGYTETIDEFGRTITFACAPASTWDVAVYDQVRYSSDGSTLTADTDQAATQVEVTTPVGPRWTTDPGEFPFDLLIGGEQVTCTAVTGTGPTQRFTVVRAVNGITKAHPTGTSVDLARPATYAL